MPESTAWFARLLEHYVQEAFTAGREEMVRLRNASSNVAARRAAAAGALFFASLESVESSYRYRRAQRRFRKAAAIFRSLKEEWAAPCGVAALFCEVETAKLAIDRGTYCGWDDALKEAVARLKIRVAALKEAIEKSGLKPTVAAAAASRAEVLAAFVEGMEQIALCYPERWKRDFTQRFGRRRLTIQKAVSKLEGHRILAYDLKSHLPVLEALAARPADGRLAVTDGTIRYLFFGVINYKVKSAFDEMLARGVKIFGSREDRLGFLGAAPHEEIMEDLWSGLKARDFTKKSVWPLGTLVLQSDKRTFEFPVTLNYYNMGVFTLCLELDISRFGPIDATRYRYLTGLGQSYALDERFVFIPNGKERVRRFAFMSEFGRYVFDRFNELPFLRPLYEELDPSTDRRKGERPLFYDPFGFGAYVVADFFDFARIDGKRSVCVALDEVVKSRELKGFLMGPREVRPAIDSWLLKPLSQYENLARYRYNGDEIVRVGPDHAVLMLPQQPDWARMQALESVEVGVAVERLLALNVALYKEALERYEGRVVERIEELGEDRVTERLNAAERNMTLLIDTLADGSMTQFPDHERFMERLMANLHIAKAKERAVATLGALKRLGERVVEARRKKRERKYRMLIALATSLLSATALSDLFDVVNAEGFTLFTGVGANEQFWAILAVTTIIFFATLKFEKEK